MNIDKARIIAERVLDENVRPVLASRILIADDRTVETDDWCVFVYNTKDYLQCGEFRKSLIGNSPVMVNKATGEAKFGRTDISIEAQLDGRRPDQHQSIWENLSDVFSEEPIGDPDDGSVDEEQD